MRRLYSNHFKDIEKSEYAHWNKLLMQRIRKLSEHEAKDSYCGINMYESYATNVSGWDFIFMPTTGFIKMCVYYDAKFANIDKTDAYSIVDSYLSEFNIDKQAKADFLSNEKCAYYIKANGEEIDRVLRLDLFRMIKDLNGREEFVGGLFHAMKHFSLNGSNYAYGNDDNESFDIRHIAYLAACAFCQPLIQSDTKTNVYESTVEVGSKKYKAVFFYESISEIYFLNTIYRIK